MAEAQTENTSSVITSLQENFLECSICMEKFTDPRILDCVHSFCFKCIKQHVGNDKIIKCPLCNQEMPIPKEGITGIKSNFFIKGIIEQLDTAVAKAESAKKTCTACESGLLTIGHCDGCQDDICSNCDELHKQINILKKHKITYFDNQENKLEDSIKVDDTKEYLKKIKLQMDVMDVQKKQIDQSVSSLTVKIDKVEKEGTNTIKAIESTKQMFIAVIESYTNELKEKVTNNMKSRLGNMKEVRNLTKTKADAYSQLKDQASLLYNLDKKDREEICMQYFNQLCELQKQITSLPNAFEPHVQSITFVEGNDIKDVKLSSCMQIIGFLLPQKPRTERDVWFNCNKPISNHMKEYAIQCAQAVVDKYGMKPRNYTTLSNMANAIVIMYEKRYKRNSWSAFVTQSGKYGSMVSTNGKLLMDIDIDYERFVLFETPG